MRSRVTPPVGQSCVEAKLRIDFNQGVLYGLLAAVSLAAMAFVVHTLSGQVQAAQVFFLRSLLVFLVLVPFTYRQIGLAFRTGTFPLWLRAVAGSIGLLLHSDSLGLADSLHHVLQDRTRKSGRDSGGAEQGLGVRQYSV